MTEAQEPSYRWSDRMDECYISRYIARPFEEARLALSQCVRMNPEDDTMRAILNDASSVEISEDKQTFTWLRWKEMSGPDDDVRGIAIPLLPTDVGILAQRMCKLLDITDMRAWAETLD